MEKLIQLYSNLFKAASEDIKEGPIEWEDFLEGEKEFLKSFNLAYSYLYYFKELLNIPYDVFLDADLDIRFVFFKREDTFSICFTTKGTLVFATSEYLIKPFEEEASIETFLKIKKLILEG